MDVQELVDRVAQLEAENRRLRLRLGVIGPDRYAAGLSPAEAEIVAALRPGEPVSTAALAALLFAEDEPRQRASIRMYVSRARGKLERTGWTILGRAGSGYRLEMVG